MISPNQYQSRPLIYFLLKVTVLYLAWYAAYEFWIRPAGAFDHIITEYITQSICFLLNHTGYTADYTIARKLGETYIYMEQLPVAIVRVGASCNGLEPMVLFAIFIIAYPGSWKRKLWYVPAGILLIHGINIARNYVLTLMAFHHHEHYEIYHRYVFVLFVYLVIFCLWILWTNKLSIRNSPAEGN